MGSAGRWPPFGSRIDLNHQPGDDSAAADWLSVAAIRPALGNTRKRPATFTPTSRPRSTANGKRNQRFNYAKMSHRKKQKKMKQQNNHVGKRNQPPPTAK